MEFRRHLRESKYGEVLHDISDVIDATWGDVLDNPGRSM